MVQRVILTVLQGSFEQGFPVLLRIQEQRRLNPRVIQVEGQLPPSPYSSVVHPQQRLLGVLVHAQMVSQILSAVVDHRPLLWVWPDWAEGLWIVGWSAIGGALAIGVRSRIWLVLSIGASLVLLVGMCWGGLLYGGRLPLVPSALALIVTSSRVVVVKGRSYSRN